MIVVFYGQPSSGKTTLANLLQETIFLQNQPTPVIIDGDEIRSIFKDTDYSKEGRLKNLKRISDIATFLDSKYNLVIISAVFPYQEAREYLDSICNNVLWVHLFYVGFRERQDFHIKDFDLPYLEGKKNCSINTTNFTPEMCIERLLDYMSL
jgi:adenylylsulfate kinase-like enzyme